MPFALVIIGLIMIVTGARNTHTAFARQVQSDFTGPGNFITWVVALGASGSLGYIKSLEQFSRYLMALIIIGLVLSNRGVFAEFNKALATGPVQPVRDAETTPVAQEPTTAANVDKKISDTTSGAFGQPATPNSGQAKFNGWVNYGLSKLFGLK